MTMRNNQGLMLSHVPSSVLYNGVWKGNLKMTNKLARFVQVLVIGVLLFSVAVSTVSAQELTLSCDPSSATANSVWNFLAVWKDPDNRWPEGLGDDTVEGFTLVINKDDKSVPPIPVDNILGRPVYGGFDRADYAATATASESYYPLTYITLQPDPVNISEMARNDARYDRGLDLIDGEISDTKIVTEPVDQKPTVFIVPSIIVNGGTGGLIKAFFDAIPAGEDDGDTENVDESHPEIPPVIVPDRVPVWLVGVWTDSDKKISVPAKIILASEIYDGWPKVNVIQITDPEIARTVDNLYYEYYCPGTKYVVTAKVPIAAPYTVYKVPLVSFKQDKLKINDAILRLDPARTEPNHYVPGVGQFSVAASDCPILGIYENADLTGPNYFEPMNGGKYAPPGTENMFSGIIHLTGMPADGWPVSKANFYVKVSTFGVQSVKSQPAKEELYISAAGVPGPYDWKQGIIKLQKPLANPEFEDIAIGMVYLKGKPVSISYSPISTTSFTVGLPELVSVSGVTPHPSADKYKFTDTADIATDSTGKCTLSGTNVLPQGTYGISVSYVRKDSAIGPVVWLNVGNLPVPMLYDKGNPNEGDGAKFRACVSAGLNMANTKQWPSIDVSENVKTLLNPLNNLIWGPPLESGKQLVMYYAPALRTDDDTPIGREIKAICVVKADVANGKPKISKDAKVTVTVHDSKRWSYTNNNLQREMINYGGKVWDCDSLHCYPQGDYGTLDADPLSIEPVEEVNPNSPDDGSSSNAFVFRVHYYNRDNLPPKPWLKTDGQGVTSSGVVLYLDETGTGDYQPHFMHPENSANLLPGQDYKSWPGITYMYRFQPHGDTMGIVENQTNSVASYPWADSWWSTGGGQYYFDNIQYQSLCIGTYHYFFSCSDDSLKFHDKNFPFEFQGVENGYFSSEGEDWGETGAAGDYYRYSNWTDHLSTGLDPAIKRHVAGYSELDREPKRRYSSDENAYGTYYYGTSYDTTIFVDRVNRCPGKFETDLGFTYPWKADSHPQVTCSLSMYQYDPDSTYHTGVATDDLFVRYDDPKYGYGRFFGTISPFYRAVNPLLPGSRTQGSLGDLAETCGASTKTDNVFRICYQQLDGEHPRYVRLMINNASEKSGTDANHKYTAYTMYPRADQTAPYDYKKGVWYEYKTKLPVGPHTYYFEAFDGKHPVKYPVRSDYINYPDLSKGTVGSIVDRFLPTFSLFADRAKPDYVDNDYIPGPYVNHPCVISNVSVSPGTGKEGRGFKYMATYSDPDGQKPFDASITIEINDRGDIRTFQLRPETPFLDPTANHTQDYINGVKYYLDTASYNDLALQKGVRRFYVKFTDDWGKAHIFDDRRQGETTRYPQSAGNWVSGPIISGNNAPTLTNSSVTSEDGTSNDLTNWIFKVKYKDLDGDEPALKNVYIGLLQPDGKMIMWDDGHELQKTIDNDSVTDGAEYYFRTKLGGPQALAEGEEPAKQYYYAFEAYDGVEWATYKASSNEDKRSDAAGCFMLQDMERVELGSPYPSRHYKFVPRLVQRGNASSVSTVVPMNADDIIKVSGVYLNEDLIGTNYYDATFGTYLTGNADITLTEDLPVGTDNVWIQYESQSPIVGPIPIDQPAPSGVIPDALVYENYSSNRTPALIDDQKNGWISEVDSKDHGVLVTTGLAVLRGNPSLRYITLDDWHSVASVEGVYLTPYLDGEIPADYPIQDSSNYYDPAVLSAPFIQTGTISSQSFYDYTTGTYRVYEIARPSDSDRFMDGVLGVYTTPDCSGFNYYAGEQDYLTSGTSYGYYDKWQKAVVVGNSTIWPTNPNDIVSIIGVYATQDASIPANSLLGDGIHPVPPSQTGVYPSGPVPEGEYIVLDKPVPASAQMFAEVYIAYRSVGPSTRTPSYVRLDTDTNVYNVYIATKPRGYVCGDNSFKLTTDLSAKVMDATVSGYTVTLSQPSLVGTVLGVYDNENMTGSSYYTAGSYIPGANTVEITQSKTGTMYVAYVPLKTKVYVKYSDLRFTHQTAGYTVMPLGEFWGMDYGPVMWDDGLTHFEPLGSYSSIHIKGNSDDITGGIIGIWDEERVTNYFDPIRTGRITNDHWSYDNQDPLARNGDAVRLSQPVPSGTEALWATYYQRGNYHIDRWNRDLVFLDTKDESSRIQASYFFGTKMPSKIMANKAPSLRDGIVSPLTGSGVAQYVYSVTYEDQDGEYGQKPSYVRVYIDGVAYDMVPQNAGTPAYNEGAVYTYTAQGLQGSKHTYRFETSDGAAVAWYDANGGHQSLLGSIDTGVKDMDGPWINNPPALTEGPVKPDNNTSIPSYQSIEYSVTYTDLDGEWPYFFDPAKDIDRSGKLVGQDVSESPRVWIDSAPSDDAKTEVLYKVADLQDDPLEPGKKRVIVVTKLDGTSPLWTTDQFAGKLMQISNEIAKRVYLIQSNSANKLIIAIDDLLKEGIKTNVGGTASQFRINGLVLTKDVNSPQSCASGVVYKLIVPKLNEGSHKYHFTARSREEKPPWLITQLLAAGQPAYPYSGPARFPANGDINGPTVISIPPVGNGSPVLSNTSDSSLAVGPKVQAANVLTADSIGEDNIATFGQIREVLGVYLNANLTGTNYHDPQTTTTPFTSGDTEIQLSPSIDAVSDTDELVQFGQANNSLLTVTPDSADAIGAILGVYVDSELSGPNYYDPADPAVVPFLSGDTAVQLTSPLPSSSSQVYIKYNLKNGVNWPPVYVNYFGRRTSSTVFLQSEPLTFRASYRDPDNDQPAYHNNVQGYVRVFFDSNAVGNPMLLRYPPATSYIVDTPFTTTLTNVPQGIHKYHFEASDGYSVVRWPQGVLGNPAANDYSIAVNYKPVLSSFNVNPTSGQSATNFVFRVRYKDTDGDGTGKPAPEVKVRLLWQLPDNTWKERVEPMTAMGGAPLLASGVDYTAEVTDLDSGSYMVIFEAFDGNQQADPQPSADSPMYISVRDGNNPPEIISYNVDPTAGKTGSMFTYKARYRDSDGVTGDAPIATLDGSRVEGLTLVIDEGSTTKKSILMTRDKTLPLPSEGYTSAAGIEYSAIVSGKTLGVGNHTFKVTASDGTDNALYTDVPDLQYGPVMLVPYFENLRIVDKANAGDPDAAGLSNTVVGQQVVVKGKIRFPYNTITGVPSPITNAVVKVTKPDNSTISLTASVPTLTLDDLQSYWEGDITVTYPSSGDSALVTGNSLTLSATGEWKVGAAWAGNTKWDKAETGTNNEGTNHLASVMVGGPIRTLAVENTTDPEHGTPSIDMITVPMIVGSTDIGQVIGYDRAMQCLIARWSPSSNSYFRYGVQGQFPALQPGEAIWIKPKTTYPAAETINQADADAGTLMFSNSDARYLDPNCSKKYRLIKPLVKAYPKVGQTLSPCVIALKTGWNQIGNIFFNWKKNAQGQIIEPREDLGTPLTEIKVRYLNQEKSLSEAKVAGWIRDYAWRYDATKHDYVLVHMTNAGADRTLRAWYGYWLKSLVDCQLVISPTTSYNGTVTGVSANLAREEGASSRLDAPPTIPDAD